MTKTWRIDRRLTEWAGLTARLEEHLARMGASWK